MKDLDFTISVPQKDIDRELVGKKLDNLKDLQFLVNSETVNSMLAIWKEKDPSNDKLKEFTDAVIGIQFYVNELQNERHLLMLSMDEYKADKLRAVDRARRAESKLEGKKN
tara:strand:+ start:679 stop:1011 length:333 start_codon:yes stop_codon:yes gene_type:complete